jgi:hypothetical protein
MTKGIPPHIESAVAICKQIAFSSFVKLLLGRQATLNMLPTLYSPVRNGCAQFIFQIFHHAIFPTADMSKVQSEPREHVMLQVEDRKSWRS